MSDEKAPQSSPIALDADRCSFCGFCDRHCPAQAFRIDADGGRIRLFFSPRACTLCEDDDSCAEICPEDAIRLVREGSAGDLPPVELLLAESEVLACSYCGELFAPLGKIEALSQEGRVRQELIRDLCPVCRRKHLVVRFIDEKRLPGEQAEYRSGKDILRRAGYGPDGRIDGDPTPGRGR